MQTLLSRRTVVRATIAAIIVGVVWMVSVCGQCKKWVGSTDVEVLFVVTNAVSGEPVSNATVRIRAESGGFCRDRERREFSLLTDSNGRARHTCAECMCSGSRSCFENTFAVHLPSWWFKAQANGYSDSEEEDLNGPKYLTQVRRGKPFATVMIPIELQKRSAEQSHQP